MIKYFILLGAIEGLSRFYVALLKCNKHKEAKALRMLIEEYIIELGIEADNRKIREYMLRKLPGEILSVNDLSTIIKGENEVNCKNSTYKC